MKSSRIFRRLAGITTLLITGLLGACGGGDGGDAAQPDAVPCSSGCGNSSLTLAWDAVVGANGYRIYYRSASGSYLQNRGEGIDAGNSTTYSVTGLVSGTTYCFAATAYGSNGESDFSNEDCQAATN
jgi:Fibronectin type III domain